MSLRFNWINIVKSITYQLNLHSTRLKMHLHEISLLDLYSEKFLNLKLIYDGNEKNAIFNPVERLWFIVQMKTNMLKV